jgi:hypothetical protein
MDMDHSHSYAARIRVVDAWRISFLRNFVVVRLQILDLEAYGEAPMAECVILAGILLQILDYFALLWSFSCL